MMKKIVSTGGIEVLYNPVFLDKEMSLTSYEEIKSIDKEPQSYSISLWTYMNTGSNSNNVYKNGGHVLSYGDLVIKYFPTKTATVNTLKAHLERCTMLSKKPELLQGETAPAVDPAPTLTKAVATVIPRISFEMVSMTYDTSRKLNSLIRNFAANTSSAIKTQFNPIPYNFDFNLSIYVRNTEDGTQILEQILPFFTPDFTVTVNFISEMNQKYDMPIILNSVQSTVDYEGDMMSTRLIMWDLQFTAKGYIWPPVKSGKYIRQANTNIYIESQAKSSQQVTTDLNPLTPDRLLIEGETIRVLSRDVVGVEVCSAIKNIYSMLIGASEGLSNTKASKDIQKKYLCNMRLILH